MTTKSSARSDGRRPVSSRWPGLGRRPASLAGGGAGRRADVRDAEPMAAGRALFDARQTDAALDAAPDPAVSMALRDRVIASAATARSEGASRAGRTCVNCCGSAERAGPAAACAGVVFGTTLDSRLAADAQAFAVLDQALVGGLDDTGVLG